MGLICWLRKHVWSERPYPSRFTEPWWYGRLPWMVEDPLIWDMVFERCDRCHDSRWVFRTVVAAKRYHDAVISKVIVYGSTTSSGPVA